MSRIEYPKMIYKDGKLSDDPKNHRIANNEDEAAAYRKEGFSEYDPASKHAEAAQKNQAERNKVLADEERRLTEQNERLLAEEDERNRARAAIDERKRVEALLSTTTPGRQGAGDGIPGANSNIGGGVNGQTIDEPVTHSSRQDNPQTIPGDSLPDATGTPAAQAAAGAARDPANPSAPASKRKAT